MKIELHRLELGPKATIGKLYLDGIFECLTLEDVVRDLKEDGSGKVQNETAIGAGTYKVIIDFSQKFQKEMLHIMDVPFFTGIRIHSGNTDENTEGCVLVGNEKINDDFIHGGSHELPILQGKIQEAIDRGEEVDITITNDFQQA